MKGGIQNKLRSPFFSVIIPLYNKRPYIRRAVDSVLGQSFTDFELIVVDDGSTDGGLDAIADISDHRLKTIVQDNMGGAGGQARNTGMAGAKGEWFAFLDGDDAWLPNHLEELVGIIELAGEPSLISPRSVELLEGAALPPVDDRPKRIFKINYFSESGRQIGLNNCSSSAIHRDIFKDLGGFINVRSGPDLEYWARVALKYPVYISGRMTSIYFRGNIGNMEQIAAERQIAPKPLPKSLLDVSPSIAMLVQKAGEDPSLFERSDIRAYINGRLSAGMKVSLRSGEPARASAFWSLMLPPRAAHANLMRVIAALPKFMLNPAISIFAWIKNMKFM